MFLAGWDGEADSTTTTTNCPVYLNRFIRPGRAAIKSSSHGERYLGETSMGRAGLAVVEGKSPTRENRPKPKQKNPLKMDAHCHWHIKTVQHIPLKNGNGIL